MNINKSSHPANHFRYCPSCGKEPFEFTDEKLFKCGHCGFNFYINAATAVCGIIELPDRRIVLTRRKFNPQAGKLDLPGGFVDILERAEDAITREIFEELGLKVSNPALFATFPNEYVFKGFGYFTCDIAFICKLDSIPVLAPEDDVSEAVFMDPTKIDFNEIGFTSIVNVLKKYQETKISD